MSTWDRINRMKAGTPTAIPILNGLVPVFMWVSPLDSSGIVIVIV